MFDLTRLCERCGATDRQPANGQCRPCRRLRERQRRIREPEMVRELQKLRVDRYLAQPEKRAHMNEYQRNYARARRAKQKSEQTN